MMSPARIATGSSVTHNNANMVAFVAGDILSFFKIGLRAIGSATIAPNVNAPLTSDASGKLLQGNTRNCAESSKTVRTSQSKSLVARAFLVLLSHWQSVVWRIGSGGRTGIGVHFKPHSLIKSRTVIPAGIIGSTCSW